MDPPCRKLTLITPTLNIEYLIWFKALYVTGKLCIEKPTLFLCHFSAPRTAALIFFRAAFRNCRSKAITKVLMGIYLPRQSFDVMPRNACRNEHTWDKIHISSWSKIITSLTGLSGPHIIPPAPHPHPAHPCSSLSGVTFELVDAMCTFSVLNPASVCCHTESLQERWWPVHHSPLKTPISRDRHLHPHLHRGRCAISTIWSAGQLGFVSWALSDEWIISSHPSPSKHAVSKGWIVEGIKRRQGCEERRL